MTCLSSCLTVFWKRRSLGPGLNNCSDFVMISMPGEVWVPNATRGLLPSHESVRGVQASRFRRDVAAARAEAEFHVKASAAIVASAIDAAPKVTMLPEVDRCVAMLVGEAASANRSCCMRSCCSGDERDSKTATVLCQV